MSPCQGKSSTPHNDSHFSSGNAPLKAQRCNGKWVRWWIGEGRKKKNKESNYCQDGNIRPLVAALGRGEKRRRHAKLNLITPSVENLFLESVAHETTLKILNGETRPECNCNSLILFGSDWLEAEGGWIIYFFLFFFFKKGSSPTSLPHLLGQLPRLW